VPAVAVTRAWASVAESGSQRDEGRLNKTNERDSDSDYDSDSDSNRSLYYYYYLLFIIYYLLRRTKPTGLGETV